MSLATKYRPTTVNGFLGDNVRDLINSGNVPSIRVLFLTGSTGSGKTSAARLIAKYYLHPDDPAEFDEYIRSGNAEPLAGVTEIDIARNSTRESVENIIQEMGRPSFIATRRVYIFDEFHMASDWVQNAFLKVLEEPSTDEVLYIFCTTDPKRILPTIRSRATHKLILGKPSLTELSELLIRVCQSEGISYDPKGIRAISIGSDFVVRSALSILEQTVTTYGSASYAHVSQILENIEDRLLWDFLQAYSTRNAPKALKVLGEVRSVSRLDVFVDELTRFITRGIFTINGVDLEDVTETDASKYRKYLRVLSVEQTYELLKGLHDLHSTSVEASLVAFIYERILQKDAPEVVKEQSTEVKQDALELLETRALDKGATEVSHLNQTTRLADKLRGFNSVKVNVHD